MTRTALLHSARGAGGVPGGAPALPGPWASPRGALSSLRDGEPRLTPEVSALGVPTHPPALRRQRAVHVLQTRVGLESEMPRGKPPRLPQAPPAQGLILRSSENKG